MREIVLTWGLISGVVITAMMWLTIPLIGENHSIVLGYATMVLAFLMVFVGVRTYRDTIGRGAISFGRALAVGGLISLITSTFYVASWMVMYATIAPDFLEKYTAQMIAQERAKGTPEAEVVRMEQQMKEMGERYDSDPLYRAALTYVEPLPVALLMTLIAAGALRRKQAATG